MLAQAGADVNRVKRPGAAPLAGAVFKDEADVVEVLLSAGADPDVGAPTARETAAPFGRPELFD